MDQRQAFFDRWLWAVVELWEALDADEETVEQVQMEDLGTLFYPLSKALYDHSVFANISNARRPVHIQSGAKQMLNAIITSSKAVMPSTPNQPGLSDAQIDQIIEPYVQAMALLVALGLQTPASEGASVTRANQGATVQIRMQDLFKLPLFNYFAEMWTEHLMATTCATCGQYALRSKSQKGGNEDFKICGHCEQQVGSTLLFMLQLLIGSNRCTVRWSVKWAYVFLSRSHSHFRADQGLERVQPSQTLFPLSQED